MTRKRRDFTRPILPDPKYGDEVVTKLVNCMMHHGKKGVAETALYGAFDLIEERMKENPIEVFHRAMHNIQPITEVRSRRVGGATYQVPTEVNAKRGQALAIRWLIQAARGRAERSLPHKLAAEILDAASRRGTAIKKREDTHRMAEANKAFAHFRW